MLYFHIAVTDCISAV